MLQKLCLEVSLLLYLMQVPVHITYNNVTDVYSMMFLEPEVIFFFCSTVASGDTPVTYQSLLSIRFVLLARLNSNHTGIFCRAEVIVTH